MRRRICLIGAALATGLVLPAVARADGGDALELHPATVAPFVLLLLAIALLPLVAGGFWHSHARKALVVILLAAPVVGYFYWLDTQGQPALHKLELALLEYLDFILLLATLYVVAGGVVLDGILRPTPLVNTLLLLIGAVLANVVGTTGASMLLIRPFLRINARRWRKRHLPVFFIFIVGNLGGLVTPLGDPPLFLGFLRGVDFFWTLHLLPHWGVGVGCVLGLFFVWDTLASRGDPEQPQETAHDDYVGPLRLRGLINLFLLLGVLAAVLLQSAEIADQVQAWLGQFFDCPRLQLVSAHEWLEHVQAGRFFPLWGGAVMAAMALLSLLLTSRAARQANDFAWGAIIEVAVLFVGIFVTMVPALELLARHRDDLGITEPWHYFWLTGGLSSFLDNAPTYLTFATIASGGFALGPFSMVDGQPNVLLQAISCGAVFMGANTYIGNGPNFMIKAIAEEGGYETPSFFGYMLYAVVILLPVFGLITYLFFWPS